jgi:Glycosyl transferases group 1
MSTSTKPRLDLLVQRQLDTVSTGNGAYLETFLRVIRDAGFATRIVFAPHHSFGNRPWASIHPRLAELIDQVVWPGSIRVGSRYWSYSPRVWGRFLIRAVKAVARRLGFNPFVPSYLGRPMRPSENATVARISNRDPSAITIAEYSSMGPVLNLLTSATRRGVFMHDLLSDRGKIWRAKGEAPDLYEASFEEEVDWCSAAELMIYGSANELDKLQAALPGSTAAWLRPEPPQYDATKATGSPRVVFLGTTHAGNTDALFHFIEDIWPRVLERLPDLEFWIAGSVGSTLTPKHLAMPGLKVLGRVERLEDVGSSDSIGVAPTRLATGVSIKVAEYLMLDMTCLAYPLAVEGFKTALNDLVTLVETPDEFADAIVSAVQDPSRRVRQAALSRPSASKILSNHEVEDYLKAAIKPD